MAVRGDIDEVELIHLSRRHLIGVADIPEDVDRSGLGFISDGTANDDHDVLAVGVSVPIFQAMDSRFVPELV